LGALVADVVQAREVGAVGVGVLEGERETLPVVEGPGGAGGVPLDEAVARAGVAQRLPQLAVGGDAGLADPVEREAIEALLQWHAVGVVELDDELLVGGAVDALGLGLRQAV